MKPTESASNIHLGVDVPKHHLDVHGLDQSRRFDNTASGLVALLASVPINAHFVCEASGGYERSLCVAAWAGQRAISVLAPDRVRAYARSRGQLAKTDRIDAAMLAAYGRERQPAATPAPSPLRATLKALLRAREHVLYLQRLEHNHREHLAACGLIETHSDERLRAYAQQIAALECEIRAQIATTPTAHTQIERLQTVRGVGEITAWTVWADLPEIGTLGTGQSAALAGLAPYARESGQHRHARCISHGRATLRRVLYMAAISASRHNSILKALYQRLLHRSKPAKLALIAVARKLIELLNLMLKNPNFQLAP